MMRKPARMLLGLFCLALSVESPAAALDADVPNGTIPSHLIVLGAAKDFHALHAQAKAISKKSKIPLTLREMVYDKKRGLILPDNHPDDVWSGQYVFRRYDWVESPTGKEGPFLSIERSDAYPGMKPGLYIIVGGIEEDRKLAERRVQGLRRFVKDAYAAKTYLYMGCMH